MGLLEDECSPRQRQGNEAFLPLQTVSPALTCQLLFPVMVTEASHKIHLRKQFKMCYCVFRVYYLSEIHYEGIYWRQV